MKRARVVLFLLLCGGALVGAAAAQEREPEASLGAEGRQLFVEGCSSCHGMDARGIPGRAPSLRGVGAASADFYLRTGRMPLAAPGDQPRRSDSPYSEEEIAALVAYVAGFGGPPIPSVHPERGSLAEGYELFAEHCMGCHQVLGKGGIAGRGVVPDLEASEAVDVAEAISVGPYVMPRLGEQLSPEEIDSIARYVEYTQDPEDPGGWGLGHVGPVTEGMVTWLLALLALVLAIRLIGERTTE